MAGPTSRAELQTYCKRQLGEPVLQINVAQEQIDDLTDDEKDKIEYKTFTSACFYVWNMIIGEPMSTESYDSGKSS